jgi:hypothetical protein
MWTIKRDQKAQSAMEYLVTYGWAILIIGIVLAALFYIGVFNPSSLSENQCILPADFGCVNAQMLPNGLLTTVIQQETPSTITVTAVGCNTNQTTANMNTITPTTLPIGSYLTLTPQCYMGTTEWSGPVGTVFVGYLTINYTVLQSGLPHTIFGSLVQKTV